MLQCESQAKRRVSHGRSKRRPKARQRSFRSANVRRNTHTGRASSTPQDIPPPPADDKNAQAFQRLLSLGMPAHREGLKFEVQPRRKRGRPPGQKKSPAQLMRDEALEALWKANAEHPTSNGYMPARYAAQAKLSREEAQWLCPLPMPMIMSTANPATVQALPSEVWARWAQLVDLE